MEISNPVLGILRTALPSMNYKCTKCTAAMLFISI